MFGFRRRKIPNAAGVKLWMVCVHIQRGTSSDMPPDLAGAIVPVYLTADNPEDAAREAVRQVRARGFEFVEIMDGKVHLLDPLQWNTYLGHVWPDFPGLFPSQDELIAGLAEQRVFFGPFAGYESPSGSDLRTDLS